MELLVYSYDGKVFNTFGSFTEINQPASTFFNKFNRRVSSGFTCVAAAGKIRNYSRVERLNSFWGN